MRPAKALAEVRAARQRQDHAAALARALEVWRWSRDAAVADAVDVLAREARSGFRPPEARTNADFHGAWLKTLRQRDPVAGAWLAESLFEKLPGADADQKSDAFVVRLRALGKAPADPRFSRALLKLMDQAPPIVNWTTYAARPALVPHLDERTLRALDALIEREHPREARLLRAVRERAPRPTGRLSELERKEWASLGGSSVKPRSGDRAALLQAVAAAPEDDRPRAVLADLLLEQQEPLGEFISLQLAEAAGHATPDAIARADALLKQHKKEWLGPLARITYRARFRRGFLTELELNGAWKAPQKTWEALSLHPLLATVEDLGGKAKAALYALFVASPAVLGLRRVAIADDVVVDALERHPPPRLRELCCRDWSRADYEQRFVGRVLPLLERLPQVTSLDCGEDVLERVLGSKVGGRLTALAVSAGESVSLAETWASLPASVRSLRWGWRRNLELRRAKTGLEGLVRGDAWDLEEARKDLQRLPGLRRVEIEVPAKVDSSALRKALVKQGVEVTVRQPPTCSGLVTGLG